MTYPCNHIQTLNKLKIFLATKTAITQTSKVEKRDKYEKTSNKPFSSVKSYRRGRDRKNPEGVGGGGGRKY